ncbi:MAG: carbohydrate kinase family protein, partial [Chloroflexi bacterium]|nr:carbohydrate kinase family protein [Chloroflexota bacterium]
MTRMDHRRFDCLCVADMCVDLVLRGNVRPHFHQVEQLIDAYHLELGGSANIFAAQYAHLGGRAGVVGYVGSDTLGEFALNRLRSLGVDTSWVRRHPALPTGLGVALVEQDDRAILTALGTIDAVTLDDLSPDLLGACRHWHIASFFLLSKLRPFWKSWLERCRASGVTTSLDTNWDPDNQWQGVAELLPWVDVFLPNEAEALAISGDGDVERAGQRLSRQCGLVAIKCGARGAYVFAQGHTWRYTPEPARSLTVVDTIGAGDCFNAGFVRAWQLDKSVDECLAWGVRCAEASLAAAGGMAA